MQISRRSREQTFASWRWRINIGGLSESCQLREICNWGLEGITPPMGEQAWHPLAKLRSYPLSSPNCHVNPSPIGDFTPVPKAGIVHLSSEGSEVRYVIKILWKYFPVKHLRRITEFVGRGLRKIAYLLTKIIQWHSRSVWLSSSEMPISFYKELFL